MPNQYFPGPYGNQQGQRGTMRTDSGSFGFGPGGQLPSQQFGGNRYTPPQGGGQQFQFPQFQGGQANVQMGNQMGTRPDTMMAGGLINSMVGGDMLRFGGGGGYSVPQYGQQSRFNQDSGGVRAGDYASEALLSDYGKTVGATQQQQQWMRDLLGQVRGVPQTAQQGLNMANQIGQQGMDLARQAGQEGMKQAGKFDEMYAATKGGVGSSLDEARRNMQAGIDTQQKAIDQQDFFRKDTVASGVSAIGSQFEQQRQQIQSNPNMTPDEKSAAIDNLKQQSHQQISMYASEADSKAADSLMQARMGLGASKMGMGQAMGSLGIQGASLVQGAGTSRANAYMAQAQENARMMQQANQFYGGITQGAMAALMRAQMDGNEAEMAMIKNYPFSGPRLADTVLAMMNAQNMRPGTKTTDTFGRRLGSLIGNPNFPGYA